ncbi:hypothetical protein QHF83_50410 [Polyangium sp. 15x6]|nr:hypothetical protein [Polyangium sp. 15x6]
MRFDTENDPEVLRQAALLLERENQKHAKKIIELTAELLALKGGNPEQLKLRIAELEQQIAQKNRLLFGEKSERRGGDEQDVPPTPPKPPQKGHGPKAQPSLPIVEVVHELDEADKVCGSCGGALEAWEGQFEESEEVDRVERELRLRRIDLLGLAAEDMATKPLELDAGELVELAILVALVAQFVPLAGGTRGLITAAMCSRFSRPRSTSSPDPSPSGRRARPRRPGLRLGRRTRLRGRRVHIRPRRPSGADSANRGNRRR